MSTQPLRNALAFLLGVAAVYLALGFLTLLIFGRTLSDMLQGTIILDAILVLMASGLLVIAGRALFVAPRRGGSRLISVSPRSSTFVDLLGPPVEVRRRANTVGLALEHSAMGELGIFEILNRGKVAVEQCRIGQRP
jgi:cytochrome c biogenesis protein CcdA